MIWLYRLLFLPVLLVMSPRYLWRMRRRGGYGRRFCDRFGSLPRPLHKAPGARRVWLQAVSVGEIQAIGPLLEALARDGTQVYLTTTTSTGYCLARERYSSLVAGLGYFPLDWWLFSARAWRRIGPDLAILMEGERWPEHIRQARLRGVPVVNINARLSDRTYSRLVWCRRVAPASLRLFLGDLKQVLACSGHDEERFRHLGVPAGRLSVTGNMKLDVPLPLLSDEERTRLRRELGLPEGLVLVGASTWPGEEAALVDALKAVLAAGLRCALLLVPRHAERREAIEGELRACGLSHHFRSRGAAPGEVDIAVADTTGELRKLVQLADLVFVGKSLPPHTEGQTPVEAAMAGKPVLFGPGMGNFAAIAADLLARGAARRVGDPAELCSAVRELLADVARRAELAEAAAAWHRENGGAVERTLAAVRDEISRSGRLD